MQGFNNATEYNMLTMTLPMGQQKAEAPDGTQNKRKSDNVYIPNIGNKNGAIKNE